MSPLSTTAPTTDPDRLALEGERLERFHADGADSAVSHRDARLAGGAIAALVVEQGDFEFDTPPLEAHFLALMLDGRHDGRAVAEGLATSTVCENRPGRLSFLPGGRAARVVGRGRGRYAQLLIDPSVMRRTMHERLVGGADGALLAFNTVVHPRVERLARTVARALLAPGGAPTLVADDLAHRLCAALVADFADAPALARAGAAPSLSAAAMIRLIERIESGIAEDLRLEALAAEVSMPASDLARAFEAEVGQSLGAFVTELRVDRVRDHLDGAAANEPIRVRELAPRFGFGSGRALERAFRARLGVGLDRYRRTR